MDKISTCCDADMVKVAYCTVCLEKVIDHRMAEVMETLERLLTEIKHELTR